MQETIQDIVEKVSFENKDKFSKFLYTCLKISKDNANTSSTIFYHVQLKVNLFFEGLAKLTNSLPKEKKLLLGVETLKIVFETLGFEMDKEEAFIMFHLRDLGKFKVKDTKLREQLEPLWKQYQDYKLNDQDFSHSIKALRRMGLIEYRKGSLNLRQSIEISHKAEW